MSFSPSSPAPTLPLPETTSSLALISDSNSCESHHNQEKQKMQNMECKLTDRKEFLNTEQAGNKNVNTQKCAVETFNSPNPNVSCGNENLQNTSVSQFTSSHMLYNAHFGSAPVAVYNRPSSSNNLNNNNNIITNNSSSSNNNSFTVISTNNLNSSNSINSANNRNNVLSNNTPSSVNTILSSNVSPFSTSTSPIISPTTAKFAARFGQSASDNAQQEERHLVRVSNDLVNINRYCNNNNNLNSKSNSPSDNCNSANNSNVDVNEEVEKLSVSAEQNMAMLYSPLGLNSKKYNYNFNVDVNEEKIKSSYVNVGLCANSDVAEKVTNLQNHFGDGPCSNYTGISSTSDNNIDNNSSNNSVNNNFRSTNKPYFSATDQNNHKLYSGNDRNEIEVNQLVNICSYNSNQLPRSMSSFSQSSNDDLLVGEKLRIASSTPSSPRFATRFATNGFIATPHTNNNSNNSSNSTTIINPSNNGYFQDNMASNRIINSNDVNLNTQSITPVNVDTSQTSTFCSSPLPLLYNNGIPPPCSTSSSSSVATNNYSHTSNVAPAMLESTCQFVRSPSTHSFTSDSNNAHMNTITTNTNNNNNNSFAMARSESSSREEVSHEPTIEVYDPDFKDILTIRISRIFHRPHPSFGVSRLVLCRNFSIDNPNGCTKRDLCKFVHADTRNATRNSIHVNYAWRSLEECTYTRLPAGEELVVLAPNERPPSELIASERILLTRGSVNWKEHSSPLSHCAHYYFNRMCNRGERCNFIHTVYVDPSVQGNFKRAPAPTAVAPILAKPTLPSTNTPTMVIPSNLSTATATATAVIVTQQALPFNSPSCVQTVSPQSVMLLNTSHFTPVNQVAVPVTLASPSHRMASSSSSSFSNLAAANTPCSFHNLQVPSLQNPSVQTSPLLCPSITKPPSQTQTQQALSAFYTAPMSSTSSPLRSPVNTSELAATSSSQCPLIMVINPVPSTNLPFMPTAQPTWSINAQTNQPINTIQQFTLQSQPHYSYSANNDMSSIPAVTAAQSGQIDESTSQIRECLNRKIEEVNNHNQSQEALKECYTEVKKECIHSNNSNSVHNNSISTYNNKSNVTSSIVDHNSDNNVNNSKPENRINFSNTEADNNNSREQTDLNQLDKIASLLSADNNEIEWLTPISQHSETTSSMGQVDWSFYGDLDDEPFVPASDDIYDIIDDALPNNYVETNTGGSDSDTDSK